MALAVPAEWPSPRRARLARWLVRAGAAVGGLAVAAGAVAVFVLHLGVAPVLTGSMRPAFDPGDALVTRLIPTRELRVGMVPVIVPPGRTTAFAHRVRTLSGSPADPVITTKGDANPQPDPWRARVLDGRVPVVVAVLPKAGYLLVWLHARWLRAALLAAAGLALTFLLTRAALFPRARLAGADPVPAPADPRPVTRALTP